MFQLQVKVTNPKEPGRAFEELFWVDTGAYHSYVPEDRLKDIGLDPITTREFVLADGRTERRLVGEALFTLPILNER